MLGLCSVSRAGKAGAGRMEQATADRAAAFRPSAATVVAAATLSALLTTVLAAPTEVAAQDGVQADVYVGSFADDEKPIAVFAFDDPNQSGFTALDSLAVYAVPGYRPEGDAFDPRDGCRFTLDFEQQLDPSILEGAPIYGPGSGRESVAFPDLPLFFAQQAMRVMVARGQVATEDEAFPLYTSCITYAWAQQLSQPEEVWRQIIEEQLPQ